MVSWAREYLILPANDSCRGQLLLCPPGRLCLRKRHVGEAVQAGAAGTGYPLGVDSAWVSGPYNMLGCGQTDTYCAPFDARRLQQLYQ